MGLLKWLNEDVPPPESRKRRHRPKPAPPAPRPVYDTSPFLLQNRPAPSQLLVLLGGIAFNVLLSYSCYLLLSLNASHPFYLAAQNTARTLSLITSSLAQSARASGSGLSGPVGVLALGASAVSANGLPSLLQFTSFLSLNLAVINALPLPGLDGGSVFLVLLEVIRGEKVEERVKEDVQGVAVLALVFFSLGTVVSDISRLLLPS